VPADVAPSPTAVLAAQSLLSAPNGFVATAEGRRWLSADVAAPPDGQ